MTHRKSVVDSVREGAIGDVVSAGTNRTLRGYYKGSSSLMTGGVVLALLGAIFAALLGFNLTRFGLNFVADMLAANDGENS
jgi:hypothetical protein